LRQLGKIPEKEKTAAELPHSKGRFAHNFGSVQRRGKAGKRKAAKGRCSLTAFFPEEIVHNRRLQSSKSSEKFGDNWKSEEKKRIAAAGKDTGATRRRFAAGMQREGGDAAATPRPFATVCEARGEAVRLES